MNLASCEQCGNVVDLKHIEFIPMQLPNDPDNDQRDSDGDLLTSDSHYNPDLVWGDGCSPLETWQCRICDEFNGVDDDD